MPANRPACRVHEPVLTVAEGGSALYEVCPRCRRLRRNDTEAEPRFRLPRTRWERATVVKVVRGAR
jgi:uncharacterized ParB-like nuclease family protein